MKKIVAVFFFLLFFIIVFLPQNAFASQNKEDIEEKLEQNIQIQLDNLDFSVFFYYYAAKQISFRKYLILRRKKWQLIKLLRFPEMELDLI